MRNRVAQVVSMNRMPNMESWVSPQFKPTPEYVRMRLRKSYFSSMTNAKKTSSVGPVTGKLKSKVKWLRYVLLALVGWGIYHILNGPSGGISIWKLKEANARELGALDSLVARKQELELEKAKLEKDSAYIEKVARKELGMAKPGEKVFRFVPPDPSAAEKK